MQPGTLLHSRSVQPAPRCSLQPGPRWRFVQTFRPPGLQRMTRKGLQQKARPSRLAVRSAMFDNLSRSLEKAWDLVRKDGRLTADNIKEPMREIRRALLEADVSLPVVRKFCKAVEEAALGAAVTKGVTPDQQLVKVVYDQLRQLMGGAQEGLVDPLNDPQVILMAGLQGTGKTTAAGKLALYLQKNGRKVLLVATDVYRPAAIDQLVTLGRRIGVPVFELGTQVSPPEIARQGLEKAKQEGYDAIIVDTAGRLQIDQDMMNELVEVKKTIKPTDTLLVVDAMTGQEAAALVKAFNDAVDITGAILTKLDGDSRGGAALSVKQVSGRPIKFVGMGEKMEALEPFYPERMAGRILGMGDVVTLVEKAEEAIKAEEAEEISRKMLTAKFDFNDFLKQYKLVAGMGNMGQIMKMLPGKKGFFSTIFSRGMNKITEKQIAQVEKQYKIYESMIQSMTVKERADPELLVKSPSRRRRVARGSGRAERDVVELLGVFTNLRMQMQSFSKMMALGGMGTGSMMSDEEMMKATLAGAGPRPVAPGRVRRKRAVVAGAPAPVAAQAAAPAAAMAGAGARGAAELEAVRKE